MPVETVVRLAEACPTIVGIKEASGTMDYTSQLLSSVNPTRFTVLSGDDATAREAILAGAQGVISVTANVAPALMAAMVAAARAGDLAHALIALGLREDPLDGDHAVKDCDRGAHEREDDAIRHAGFPL